MEGLAFTPLKVKSSFPLPWREREGFVLSAKTKRLQFFEKMQTALCGEKCGNLFRSAVSHERVPHEGYKDGSRRE
jgi:hypothetical protein